MGLNTLIIVWGVEQYYWGINNLTVNTQSGETIKDNTGYVDAPLVCDIAGASIELIWEGTYWRLFS